MNGRAARVRGRCRKSFLAWTGLLTVSDAASSTLVAADLAVSFMRLDVDAMVAKSRDWVRGVGLPVKVVSLQRNVSQAPAWCRCKASVTG